MVIGKRESSGCLKSKGSHVVLIEGITKAGGGVSERAIGLSMADGCNYVQNLAEEMLVFETVQLLGVGGDSSAMTQDTIAVCRPRLPPECSSTPQIVPLPSSHETMKPRAGHPDPAQQDLPSRQEQWTSLTSSTADHCRIVSGHDPLNSPPFADSDVDFTGDYARTADGEDPRLSSGRRSDAARGGYGYGLVALVPKKGQCQKGGAGDDCCLCLPCSYCYR
ncbi:hypothetical protein MPTK1_2g21790 [Marchantia polymorpha subsp. ruderalis]|uniref:Uncharacterized protein n=1 Tax=Marchantia polymorpha TaxID=3197 RepID=A0A2R6X2Q2_MARPO|nr:hypothetical protein MARPO_0040s0036 [Marchantia polymorpha]BBN03226.1 hypothetical protein Mp_2g21790 [Marchantia polymorpha subsp. ruderalis]|eukprot:PTQ40351.1 hypothetical protein MARPO_0040s0036 [Marchantia polymorpha]